MRKTLLLATFAIIASPVHAQTPAQWREDLRVLTEALTKVHPEPFHDTSPETFNAAVKKLDADIPNLTNNQILVRMLGIIAMVKDAHTQIHAAPAAPFPVRIYKFSDGIFVTGVSADNANRIGAEILAINGRPVNAVWDSVQKIAAGDNHYSRMEAVPRFIANPRVMNGLGLSDTTQLILDLKLKSVTREKWMVTTGSSVTIAETRDTAAFTMRRDGNTLYAKFNNVNNGIVDFGRKVLATIDSSDVDKLIIDLRDNPGGNNDLAKPIVTGIARSKLNTRGKLFVITGRRTYSAAMNFTSMLEDQTRAIFVGEPPGGSPHHYGDATVFAMPNSKMNFTVSTLRWDLGVQPMDVRIEMEPDISAPPSHAAVANNSDPALDSIRAYTADRKMTGGAQNALKAAWASVNSGQREQIFANFKAVTDAYPDSHQAWFEMARVYSFIRDWKSAAEALRKAHALRPQHALTKRLLAAAELRL